jgi:hypothetical protein
MINDGINDVPDKTIAIFPAPSKYNKNLTQDRILNMVKKSDKKRDWFTPHFYRCLPLTIGNQYGFTISSEFDFSFDWDGGDNTESLRFYLDKKIDDSSYFPNIKSHFGHGIISINPPFFFRTPPGVNLITMNPPNHIIPNITVMTGVIETDNLRKNLTFNLKVQIPNIKVTIPAGLPLAAFMPIPRYYGDKFNLDFAENLFSKELVDEEIKADADAGNYREKVEPTLKHGIGKHYMQGKDIYGNMFKDHQKP